MGKPGRKRSEPGRIWQLVESVAGDLPWDEAFRAALKERLGTIMSLPQVAARFEIGEGALRAHVRKGTLRSFSDGAATYFLPADVEAFAAGPYGKQAREKRNARIVALWRRGWKSGRIAEVCGCSQSTVGNVLRPLRGDVADDEE